MYFYEKAKPLSVKSMGRKKSTIMGNTIPHYSRGLRYFAYINTMQNFKRNPTVQLRTGKVTRDKVGIYKHVSYNDVISSLEESQN